jgi:hypothetical protein
MYAVVKLKIYAGVWGNTCVRNNGELSRVVVPNWNALKSNLVPSPKRKPNKETVSFSTLMVACHPIIDQQPKYSHEYHDVVIKSSLAAWVEASSSIHSAKVFATSQPDSFNLLRSQPWKHVFV